MSNISTQRDGRGCEQTNESGNAPMLITPSVSCWETWRWEVIRASRRGRTRSLVGLRDETSWVEREHFARREVVMRPRFRTEREDWVQRVVADGHAICILPERSAAAPGLVTRPIEGLSLERELVIATVSGSTTPVEIRKIAQLASRYEWQ